MLAPFVRRGTVTAAVLLALAFGLRLGAVEHIHYAPINDARSYLRLATEIAHAGDYSSHGPGVGGTIGPSAYFAPAYPYLLAGADLLVGRTTAPDGSVEAARVLQALLGTLIVALIGLVASELFGIETALLATGIAAVYPVLIELSAVIVAEDLLTCLELAAVYAALRARRAPDPLWWTVACGVLIGLAALSHANGILIAIPLAFAVRRTRTVIARRLRPAPTIMLATVAVTIAPWMIRDAMQLHAFVPITDEAGITLAGTYNPTSQASRDPPWKWRYFGRVPSDRAIADRAAGETEPRLDADLESRALRFIASHPLAPVEVAADNTLRLLELEGSAAWRASAASIGIPLGFARIAVVSFWLLALLTVAGLCTAAARTAPRWWWGIALVMWLSVVLVNAETPRFREPLEPFLITLAACGLASMMRGPLTDPGPAHVRILR